MFQNGKIHGKGEYIWSHGKKYVGQFTDGQITGKGVKTLPVNPKSKLASVWGQLKRE